MTQPFPWHRSTGVEIIPGMSIEQQLNAANLNWQILTSPFTYGSDSQQTSEGKYEAAYRSDTEELISVYGNRRRPYQNYQVVTTFNEFCSKANLSLDFLGSMNSGKEVYAAAKLPGMIDVKNVGDYSEAYLVLNENHAQSQGDKIFVFINRLVCTNGMRRWVQDGQSVISHSREYSPAKVTNILDKALAVVQKHEQRMNQLADVSMTAAEAQMHLISAFGNPDKSVEDQPRPVKIAMKLFLGEAKGSEFQTAFNTAYGLLQAVSEYYGWYARSSQNETVFSSLISGDRAIKQERFEQQLVSVYGL